MTYIMTCVREMIVNPEFAQYLERNDKNTFRRLLNHVEEANDFLEEQAKMIWQCWKLDCALEAEMWA